jgi:hypothetical protein
MYSAAAFCEAAPRVKCQTHLPYDTSIVRDILELLLSLLFALVSEAR